MDAVGIPQEYFCIVTLLSLLVVLLVLLCLLKRVTNLWVTWRKLMDVKRLIPHVENGVRETIVMINLGGGVIPALIGLYLLLLSIPS